MESYQGAIEFLFELGTWLTYIGKTFSEYFAFVRLDEDAQSTRNIIESVVKEAILQNYDRSKAITCLTDEASAVSFLGHYLTFRNSGHHGVA